MTARDNGDYIRVLLYAYYIYHYYRVGGPPNVSIAANKYWLVQEGEKNMGTIV